MASIGSAQAELHNATQEPNNGQRSAESVFQYPRAPKMGLKELPTIDHPTQEHPTAINYGNDQWIPPNLLFHNDIRPGIDSRLAYSSQTRAVAQPLFTCLPSTHWGAVGNPVVVGNGEKQVGFEEAFDPAARPPLVRMVIHTETNNMILVEAEQGGPWVTVVDIQRAVIDWMRETRGSSGTNNLTRRFSKLVRMVDEDGTEAEVEIWVWKGLRALSTDMIHWHLHLSEA